MTGPGSMTFGILWHEKWRWYGTVVALTVTQKVTVVVLVAFEPSSYIQTK